MKRGTIPFWVFAALLPAAAYGLPILGMNEYYFYISYIVLQYVVLATAWNILGGYAGYVNFGTGAFFGAGAYAALVVMLLFEAPLVVQIAVAALVGALMGLGAGLLTLRLKGIFFSIATIAVAIIIETFVLNWRFVGGATGVQIIRGPVTYGFETHTRMLFFVMSVLAVASLVIARYIETSWLGRGLQALRDAEVAAECSGVPTLRLKLIACAVSGALMAAAGAPLPLYSSFVEPHSVFSLNYSVMALSMAVIGGMARWWGPALGAVLIASSQQFAAFASPEFHLLIVGLLLIFVVIAAPGGLVGVIQWVGNWRVSRKEINRSASVVK
ncbi:MAG: branched-chain amino acid ABC transporter permease [Cryobacterium sp.]|nr:branched-chain amino acid ABC transporter permease [Cryobacterium sp.]MBX3521163.1 branched-chain amino acid ABC transporter permease [Xanthobacteraceae bacterium]MBX3549030.1 branched-chain amino acid ABC transporter permease [Xanthobacteraceae bacterium]MCW5675417.1 branched-chain amino acid ABC transporter permease [Xanthobacteraceae bacterium]MCW5676571.1 branched-chain amino acid ABC transporter permease [Xanthobacteraceae bacterium]